MDRKLPMIPMLALLLPACVPVRLVTMDGPAYGTQVVSPDLSVCVSSPDTMGLGDRDPRWSTPVSLEELEAMTSQLKQANGLGGSNGLQLDAERSRGMASIRTNGQDGMISIHPGRLGTVPLNSWAFILGHELAHQTFTHDGRPNGELEADVEGAFYAVRAGYDPAAYLAWVMRTQGPGARERVAAVGHALRVPPQAVWANLR